jgi:hypothetical protein
MDVSCRSCWFVCRGEDFEILQVWQLLCPAVEGQPPMIILKLELHFHVWCANTLTFQVAIYPGNVLTLQMSKPPTFRYKSGQYMFVQCPAVSPFEWYMPLG